MACDTRLRPRQSLQERAEEVRRSVSGLNSLLATGRVTPVIGPQGAIAFQGWGEAERDGVSDACAYRRLMTTGSSLAKAKIAQAEARAGRMVDRKVIAQGHHSHDGGGSWSTHKH